MILIRSKVKKCGILCGLLILSFGIIFYAQRNSPSITIIHLGVRDTMEGPRHLFEISNSLPYRINWLELEPEFELESGWTRAKLPQLPGGARPSPGNPEPLEPGRSYQVAGAPATNVAHRLPVMWEIYPRDADLRPRWIKVADEWAERRGIRPPFLPHGIQRGPVIPPTLAYQITEANVDVALQEVRADSAVQVVDQQGASQGPSSQSSGGVSTGRVVFAGPTSLEGWTQGQARTVSRGSEAWSYTNGALATTTFGSIARDVQLPAVASVEFDLTWSKPLHLGVAMYADSLQPLDLRREDHPTVGGFYSLQFNGDTADMYAVSPGVSVKSLGMAKVAGLREKTNAHIIIRIHKPNRRLWLYLDDTLIKQWDDGENTSANGTCLRFVSPGLTRLEISKLVVSEWDEQTDAPTDGAR